MGTNNNYKHFNTVANLVRTMPILRSNDIWVGGEWVDRELFYIRLQHNTISENDSCAVCVSYYEIKLNLDYIPPEYFLEALNYIFSEIFFIMKYNGATKQGSERVRVVLTSESLSNPINLRSINTNDDLDAERLMLELERMLQSNESLFVDDSLY